MKLNKLTLVFMLSALGAGVSVNAAQIVIERFDSTSVHFSEDGDKRVGKIEAAAFGELPIPVLEANEKYLKVERADGSTVWIMKRQVTTSELNGLQKNCAVVAKGDKTRKEQGAIRGVDGGC